MHTVFLPSSPPCHALASGRPPGCQVAGTHSGPEGPPSCRHGWWCSLQGSDPLNTLTWPASCTPSAPAKAEEGEDVTSLPHTAMHLLLYYDKINPTKPINWVFWGREFWHCMWGYKWCMCDGVIYWFLHSKICSMSDNDNNKALCWFMSNADRTFYDK